MLRAASGKPVISYLGVLARRSIPSVFIRGWVRLHKLPMNAATSQTNSSLQEVELYTGVGMGTSDPLEKVMAFQ